MKSRFVDSALLLAIFSGLFFAVGHFVEIRRARDYGIDLSLMPHLPAEAVVFLGARYAVLFLLILSIPVLIATFFCSPWIESQRSRGRMGTITALGSLSAVVLLLFVILFLPSSWYRFTRPDGEFSPVTLVMKDGSTRGDLRFFSQREGLIVFKKPNSGGFLCLRTDDIRSLELGRKDVDPQERPGPGLTAPPPPR